MEISKIPLDDQYYIITDSNNWTLHFEGEPYEKNHKGKMKTVVPKDQWHFGSIKQCFLKYISEATKVAEDVEEVVDILLDIENLIEKK